MRMQQSRKTHYNSCVHCPPNCVLPVIRHNSLSQSDQRQVKLVNKITAKGAAILAKKKVFDCGPLEQSSRVYMSSFQIQGTATRPRKICALLSGRADSRPQLPQFSHQQLFGKKLIQHRPVEFLPLKVSVSRCRIPPQAAFPPRRNPQALLPARAVAMSFWYALAARRLSSNRPPRSLLVGW